ncbi:peptide-methionine (S)-S-oxide reductase MsrA [Trichloromonas sp.]|uniref:peptide-methionine (S)-S-oxide reductase MsrA n=1 Tax=Trichloromonas sp. TaxID=3069249 RepID=UPI003D813125
MRGVLFVLALLLIPVLAGAAADEGRSAMNDVQTANQKATFAGGCFWCMEPPFEKLAGVVSVTSGYTGGSQENPSYEDVSAGFTHHLEAIQVLFDPVKISYAQLLEVFWRNIDPTDPEGQFVDEGAQYRTAIFYHDEQQRALAEASKQQLAASGRFDGPIVTEIRPAMPFYPAEEYHQDYYKKSPIRYKFYRHHSGRDRFIDKVWGEDER